MSTSQGDAFFRKKQTGPRAALSVFLTLLVLSLVKYIRLALYAHPVADDFCYAAKSRGMGLWDWSLSEWLNWNGRYASNLLMARGPLTWSPHFLPGYRAVPIILLCLTVAAFWFLLRRITRGTFTTLEYAVAAFAFTVLYLDLMPDLGEGYYWYTGAATYQWGSILLLVHLALLSGRPLKGWRGAGVAVLNILLAVIIVGMDEIHMLIMLGLHLGMAMWRLRRSSRAGAWPLMTLAVIGGAVLMYLAPGNAVRGTMFADTHRLLPSIGMSALQTVRFIGWWIISPALLAMSALYVPMHRHLVGRMPFLHRTSPWLAAALPVLLVMACSFPAYWSTGILGQHRTENVGCLFFIPLWFLNLALWMERRPLRRLVDLYMAPTMIAVAAALTLLALDFTRNGLAATIDLHSGSAANYDRVMLGREAEVRNAAADPSRYVTFGPLTGPPMTLPSYEEHGPLRGWMVDCESRFFGAEEWQVRQETR
jgi:hypothetical protein